MENLIKPLISVIMGVYNAENTVSEAIDSIISQTYTNWEFIICDDCSTDSTLKIIEKYASLNPKIKCIHNESNMRLAATLNNCLKEAKGTYIARMDADDISVSNRLEKQVQLFNNHPEYDCIGTNRLVFDNSGRKEIRKSIEYPSKDILLLDTPFAHPTIMMKKAVYDKLNGYTVSGKTMRAEDLDLWFRFYQHGFVGYNIQEELYYYRESKDDFRKRSLKAGIETMKVFLDGYEKLSFPFYKRVFALKPVLSALLPNSFMYHFHEWKDRNEKIR